MRAKYLSTFNLYAPQVPFSKKVISRCRQIKRKNTHPFDARIIKQIDRDFSIPGKFNYFLLYITPKWVRKAFFSKRKETRLTPFATPIGTPNTCKTPKVSEDKGHTLSSYFSLSMATPWKIPLPYKQDPELLLERKKEKREKLHLPIIRKPGLLKGTLIQDPSGFLYLKIDSPFLKAFIPHLRCEETYSDIYPYFGAHIPLMSSLRAQQERCIGNIQQIGQSFYFGIKGLYEQKMYDHPELDILWYLDIESSSLSQLMRKLIGKEVPLALVIGANRKEQKLNIPRDSYYRINPSYHMA